MTIAPKLRRYLDRQHAVYELIEHPPALSASGTAAAAHIPPSCLVKAVLLDTPDDEPLLALLSSDRRVDLEELRAELHEMPRLADEQEIFEIFDDCAPGAVPPIGIGYGVTMIVDDNLAREPDLFFEAGDHRSLVHMEQSEFRRITSQARRGSFGTPVVPLE